MALTRLSLKRSLLLSAVFAVSLLSSGAFAQNGGNGGTTTGATTTGKTTTTNNQRTTTNPTTGTGTGTGTATNTNTNTRSTSQSSSSLTLPALGGTTSGTGKPPALTGLPTLSTTVGGGPIPVYPPPTIPPTQNAPFMNHSTLPDGTVFIAVGAILGAFGVAILAWRGIVACLLHRSVERAALAQHVANDKASTFPAPPSHFQKIPDRDPSPTHGGGGAAAALIGRVQKKTQRGAIPTATPSQTNLFFSPTAASGGSTGIATSSNRDSRYLPSGFYASASPMPGQHSSGNSISLSTLRPSSRGRGGPTSASPPESPEGEHRRNFSTSTVNLNRPPSVTERAPSAFLDDLLGDQPGSRYSGQFQGQQYPAQQHPTQQYPPQQYPAQQYGGQQYPARFPPGPDGQYYSQSPSPPGHRGY